MLSYPKHRLGPYEAADIFQLSHFQIDSTSLISSDITLTEDERDQIQQLEMTQKVNDPFYYSNHYSNFLCGILS